MRRLLIVTLVMIAPALLPPGGASASTLSEAAQAADLRIVALAGEDAVNIIQQKTSVAPVVEVRDRNDQSVAGAVVKFAIQGGRASFNGARTLTLTTNAAGRATVTGLTPKGTGVFQINASASFRGQTAVATIAQTNVMTAARHDGQTGPSLVRREPSRQGWDVRHEDARVSGMGAGFGRVYRVPDARVHQRAAQRSLIRRL